MIDELFLKQLKKSINEYGFSFIVVLFNNTNEVEEIKDFLKKEYKEFNHTSFNKHKGYFEFLTALYQNKTFMYIDNFKDFLEDIEFYTPLNQKRDKISSFSVNIVAFYPKALEDKLYKDALNKIPDFWDFRTTTLKVPKIESKENIPTKEQNNSLPLQYIYGSMKQQEKQQEIQRLKKRLKSIEDNKEKSILYNNLAGLYRSQGDYQKAEEFYLKALKIREEVLGTNHPDTATTYNNLALLYRSQGDYQKAEEFYLKALKITEEILGTNHPDTATTYNNLAGLYYLQGDYQKAEEFYLKALKITEEVLGTNHPDTATTYNNLAWLYFEQKELNRAKEYWQKALKILKDRLPEGHRYIKIVENGLRKLEFELKK